MSSSQKSPVLSVACGSRCDAFATCAQDGTVRVWDLSDFGVVAEASDRLQGAVRGGRALFLCWLGEEAVVTGWSDCSVRLGVRCDIFCRTFYYACDGGISSMWPLTAVCHGCSQASSHQLCTNTLRRCHPKYLVRGIVAVDLAGCEVCAPCLVLACLL